jgi:hypothetical protein
VALGTPVAVERTAIRSVVKLTVAADHPERFFADLAFALGGPVVLVFVCHPSSLRARV